jgi:hypothetical protein
MKTTETFEQFTERMSDVEMDKQYVVGRACYGHTRSIFMFEGQCCWLESSGYRTNPVKSNLHAMAKALFVLGAEPKDEWQTQWCAKGEERAKKISKHYGGTYNENPYADEPWFNLCFAEFENLMRFVYDRHTGEFEKLFGNLEDQFV